MFCRKCGAEINETARFCVQCGAEVQPLPAKKKGFNKKYLFAVLAALLAIIVVVVCVKRNDVNASPEKVAVATVKSEYEADIKTMMKCFPGFTLKDIAVEEGLPVNASRKEIIKAVEENYRYEKPQKVVILKAEVVGEFDTEEYTIYRELFDNMTDRDYASITSVALVEVDYMVDGDKKSSKMPCIEMNKKWYFLRQIF